VVRTRLQTEARFVARLGLKGLNLYIWLLTLASYDVPLRLYRRMMDVVGW